MIIKLNIIDFYNRLKNTKFYNDIKIIKDFKNYWTSVILEDKYGLIKVLPGVLVTNGYKVQHAINRDDYIFKKLKDVNPTLYEQTLNITYISKNKYLMDTIYGKVIVGDPLKVIDYLISMAIDKNDFFRKKAERVRSDFNNIDYTHINYTSVKDNLQLRCKIHNYGYKQRSTHHILGTQGCPYCMKQTVKYDEYNFEKHKDFFKNKQGILYVIKLSNNNEEFFKIGITSPHRLEYRMNQFRKIYNVYIEYIQKGFIKDIYLLEQKFLREFNKFKYKPLMKFTGYTECLTLNPVIEYYQWCNNKN